MELAVTLQEDAHVMLATLALIALSSLKYYKTIIQRPSITTELTGFSSNTLVVSRPANPTTSKSLLKTQWTFLFQLILQ
jgi:hypothetical protein